MTKYRQNYYTNYNNSLEVNDSNNLDFYINEPTKTRPVGLIRPDNYHSYKPAKLKPLEITKSRSYKRSSSESNIRDDNSNVSQSSLQSTSPNAPIFKSRSSKNLAAEKPPLKTFIKNKNAINIYDRMPNEHMPPLYITNQEEVKRKFLESNVPPVLKFKGDKRAVNNILTNYNKPTYKHFFKAKNILDEVKAKFKDLGSYYQANFGKKIKSDECVELVGKYLTENRISGEITINFAPGLTCSGRIISYNNQKNKPEGRKFLVWINDDPENQFLRKKGIVTLCDHEIGTHYYRAYNDGLQVWYSDRAKYGLRPLNSSELLKTEEGLAALHTLMNANLEYLFLPALLYYLVCMADKMTFEQLYNHMEKYIEIPNERWKLVTRVKRGISDPFTRGCYSRDQSYLEGAIDILENIDNIDFMLLMSGKICLDELDRIKRISRTDSIKTPKFLRNLKMYKDKLRQIGITNGIIDEHGLSSSSITSNYYDESNRNSSPSYENGSKLETPRTQRSLLSRNQNMASYEVERYINREIVSKTKSTVEDKPQVDENDSNSSLCTIL